MRYVIQRKHGPKEINLNRRKAIRERCLNCSAWSTDEILKCKFTECALYHFRSGQGKQNAKDRSKAIRGYCLWCMVGSGSEVSKCPSSDCSLFPYRKTAIDRSAEIKSSPKFGHIGQVLKDKIEN